MATLISIHCYKLYRMQIYRKNEKKAEKISLTSDIQLFTVNLLYHRMGYSVKCRTEYESTSNQLMFGKIMIVTILYLLELVRQKKTKCKQRGEKKHNSENVHFDQVYTWFISSRNMGGYMHYSPFMNVSILNTTVCVCFINIFYLVCGFHHIQF